MDLKRTKNFLVGIISIVVTCLILEVALRIFMGEEIKSYNELLLYKRYVINGEETAFSDQFIKDDIFAFKLKPNYKEIHIDKLYDLNFSFKTNSEGFRQSIDSIRLKNASSKIHRVMVLGDSVTFGHGVEQEFSYPEIMNAYYGDSVDVLNFGTGGWGFAEYYLTFEQYKERIKPDLVIIGVFVNDFLNLNHTNWKGKSRGLLPGRIVRRDFYVDSEGHFRTGTIAYRYPSLRNSYLCIFFSNKLDVILDKINDLRYDTVSIAASLIRQISKETPVLVLMLPAQYSYNPTTVNDSNKRFKKLLDKVDNIYILDFYPILKENNRFERFYLDGAHFNEEGNYFIAKRILEFIRGEKLLTYADNEFDFTSAEKILTDKRLNEDK